MNRTRCCSFSFATRLLATALLPLRVRAGLRRSMSDAKTVDARQFVTDAKQILSAEEYQSFVSALQTLRVTCGHEGEDIDKVSSLLPCLRIQTP